MEAFHDKRVNHTIHSTKDGVFVPGSTCRQRSASTPELDHGSFSCKKSTSSCQALRHALLTLYRLDDFIQEPLGNGFFSEVFKVTHKVTGEVMVLKMNTNVSNRQNVLREVQLMNSLSHPNILKFLGVCVHGGHLSALTEYMNGGSLHELLANKEEQLEWCERIQFSCDISNALGYLHSKGLFHRDLTSRNILISADGTNKRAIVGDFGLTTKIPTTTTEDFRLSVVGSPYWMAPECIQGLRYDERADVFSYGIVLCEIIARIDADPDEMPRTGNFGLDYVALSGLVGDCPLHFLYLAFRCCQMDPSKRPTFPEISDCLQSIKLPTVKPCQTSIRPCIASGYVRRSIRKFSNKAFVQKRSKTALQNLDFLKNATAQYIGEHMSKEDVFYEPSSATINPFKTKGNLFEARKILAEEADNEIADPIDLSVTLPVVSYYSATSQRRGHTLPDNLTLIEEAINQFNKAIKRSQRKHDKLSPSSDNSSTDSAVETCSVSDLDISLNAAHSNYLNLECAMLFSGLDLIRMNKCKSQEVYKHNPTDACELETEFQDDLKDVLRSCSSSESWLSSDDTSATQSCRASDSSSTTQNVCSDDLWDVPESHDTSSWRYLHPTLIEKRKQLRRVEFKAKEKLEKLQIKLDELKLQTNKRRKYPINSKSGKDDN